MLGRTRIHTRARGSGAGAGSTTTTDLQRILALSPSLLIWPEQGAGWQGTSGGTLAASGQPLGLGADLSQLGGKTLDAWLAAPTTSELVSGLPSIQLALWVGNPDGSVTGTAIGGDRASWAISTSANKLLVVQFEVTGYSGSGTMRVQISDSATADTNIQSFTVSANGTYTALLLTGSSTAFVTHRSLTAFTGTVSRPSVRELPGNHLRAGTWASPSDAARASYVIQTNPALYDVSGQPELVSNGGPFTDTTGWTAQTGVVLSTDSENLTVDFSGAASLARASVLFDCVVGRAYRIQMVINRNIGTTGSTTVLVSSGSALGGSIASSVAYNSTATDETVEIVFVATATTMHVGVSNNTQNGSLLVKSASAKEIPASQYKYALSFGGVDDYYSLLNAISITENMTVVRAFKRASAAIRSAGLGSATANTPEDLRYDLGNNRYIALGSTELTIAADASTGAFVASTIRNASAQYLRQNGTQVATGTPSAAAGSFDTVGNRNGNYNNGEISFLALFPTELTGADLALVEQIAAATNGATIYVPPTILSRLGALLTSRSGANIIGR